jgi:hypothetical protein
MKTTRNLLGALLLTVLTTAAAMCDAQDYTLEAIKITANAPVEITMPTSQNLQDPMYSTIAGDWKKLAIVTGKDGISFSLPPDAVGSSLVLLAKPAWLTLPDTEPPVIQAISVAGKAAELVEGEANVGHLNATPTNIMVTAADKLNPIHPQATRVLINGQSLSTFGGSLKLQQSADGKHADILITPGTLPADKYTLTVEVADAAPARSSTAALVIFNTAPLLRDGGFEELTDNGKLKYWSFGSWHSGDPTEYKIEIAKGEGRTGNAVKFTGVSGRLNMVVGQPVDLVPGRTYLLSGYYKSETGGGWASLIGTSTTGDKGQYTNTGHLAKSPDWAPFAWELTAAPDNKGYIIYLRSTSMGSVYFDDLTLKAKE